MLDARQLEICNIYGRTALVTAGPGCGKTHILALRILKANSEHGVGFEDMLCLTFTNRAAREMNERIAGLMGYLPESLFAGNMHRFCFRFLFANGLIAPDTGIMDENDLQEYLVTTFGITSATDAANFRKAAVRVYQDEHNFPEGLKQRLRFVLTGHDYRRIREYMAYKEHNRLIDFDEMILRVYEALSDAHSDYPEMSSYSWIQVDEVQDMTPLQLAIVDRLLSSPDKRTTCLYLGDEQQAIFSFLGAGGTALDKLKKRCGRNAYHLSRNYRSSHTLVNLCNELAAVWLDTDPSLLPEAPEAADGEGEARLVITGDPGISTVSEIRRMQMMHPGESIAVLTHTNVQGSEVSGILSAHGISHVHLNRNDLFKQASFKTVFSHIAVAVNPFRGSEWARLLYQTGSVRTMKDARLLCAELADKGVCPAELLSSGEPVHLERFCSLMSLQCVMTVAVLDTETSGPDIFEDDVVQIAAVKMRGGRIVAGSEFRVVISTEKALPRKPSHGTSNPPVETYAPTAKVAAEDGLRLLAEYLSGADAVAGHNLDFDLPVLRFNYSRRTPRIKLPRVLSEDAPSFDTLWVSRLLFPRLHDYSLDGMLGHLGLRKTAPHHPAPEAAGATARLAIALYPTATAKLPLISALRKDRRVMHASCQFDRAYGADYHRARALLTSPDISAANTLTAEMSRLHDSFTSRGLIAPIIHYDYVCRLIGEVMVNEASEPRFREQAMRRLNELLTFSESDLFTNGIIREKVSVMTIHKAKGLEMDNVIIYDADHCHGTVAERAKVFYVAFSRARRRLIVLSGGNPDPIVRAIRNKFI